ncbi:cytidine deaminase [Dinghuibacter silviterrae]|uniref:Cytidine deaminase n=1 Tax=Dinghuibacter silviterrae TaxID=1539049 RepID=A0A4R8DUZ3_9BACT|nr:cytidine deaminase [Dinghuibacter silviterrae]TDX01738.1 cytidine deaminase [Dinghuibacter silviterrae]
MATRDFHLSYTVYDSVDALPSEDAALMRAALDATRLSYAPYSRFRVGAAARMQSGAIVSGSNQENASYPVGICAERTLLSVASTLYPGEPIDTLAVTAAGSREPISPCGICRQSLLEFQGRTGRPLRLLMGGEFGPVWVVEDARGLLPLAFTTDNLLP